MDDWDTGLVYMPGLEVLPLCACSSAAGKSDTPRLSTNLEADCSRQMIINMVPRSGERFHLSLLKTVLRQVFSLLEAR